MDNDNAFELIIAVVFAKNPQLGWLGPKAQYLVIDFCHSEGETLPQFHFRSLQIRSEIVLLLDKIGRINNLRGKYIIALSKLKYLQIYMTPFQLYYRNFERLPQSHQIPTTFTPTIKEVSGNLDIADTYMTSSHSIIEPIINRSFGNTS